MVTKLLRPRLRPTWNGSLRRGRERHSMAAYLAAHPDLARRLREMLAEARARGYEQMSMGGVKQPFDYEPRYVLGR